MCPPRPGMRSIAIATISAASASTGSAHHSGGPLSIAEIARQVHEHASLNLVDELEKAPRGQRDDDADDRRDEEQDDEAPAVDRRIDLLRRKLRFA